MNLLEILLGKFVTACVMLQLVGDWPDGAGYPILMRRVYMAAVGVSNRWGDRQKRRPYPMTNLPMTMLGRLKLALGGNHAANHIPGVQNTLADRISRWPRVILADKARELAHSNGWYEQPIGGRGRGFFDVVLPDEDHSYQTRQHSLAPYDERRRRT